MTGTIYALLDSSFPEEVCYVGKTIQTLQARLKAHINEAKHQNHRRACWIKSLQNSGKKPIIKPIEENVSDDVINQSEIYWISYYKKIGQAKLNGTDGGDGVSRKTAIKHHEEKAKQLGKMTVAEKKLFMLSLPNDAPRPNCKDIRGTLQGLISSSHRSYDKEFATEIRKKFPHWFNRERKENYKKVILSMPVGSQRPTGRLGQFLNTYTLRCRCTYDKEFDEKIRILQPDWFHAERKEENKKKLLGLNGARPARNSYLDRVLRSYMNAKRKSYDEDFAKEIKLLQPHWFKK